MEQRSSNSTAVLFMAHRFQHRTKVLHDMLEDVSIRLQVPSIEQNRIKQFESSYEASSLGHFYEYCLFVFESLIEASDNIESAFSVLNLVLIYWKEKHQLSALKHEEITVVFKAVVQLQNNHRSTPFLNDQVKAILAARLHADNELEAAMDLQKSVAELRYEKLGAEDIACAESAFKLADVYKNEGFIQLAIHWYDVAMVGLEANLGSRHEKTKLCMTKAARCHELLGQLESAKSLYQRLLAINESHLGKNNVLTLSSMRRLALCYLEKKEFFKADLLFQQLHKLCLREFGPNHSYSISSVIDLGICRVGRGEYRSAELLFLDVIASIDHCDNCHESEKVNVYVNLARCYAYMNKFVRADEYFQRALCLSEKYLGSQHEDTYLCVKNMAVYYQSIREYDRAEEMYLYALAVAEGCHRYHVARVTEIRYLLSSFYRDRKRFELAESILAGAIRHLDARDIQVTGLSDKLELSYLDTLRVQGKYRATMSYVSRILQSSIEQYGAKHPNSQASLASMVDSVEAIIDDISIREQSKENFCSESFDTFYELVTEMDENVAEYVRNLYEKIESGVS